VLGSKTAPFITSVRPWGGALWSLHERKRRNWKKWWGGKIYSHSIGKLNGQDPCGRGKGSVLHPLWELAISFKWGIVIVGLEWNLSFELGILLLSKRVRNGCGEGSQKKAFFVHKRKRRKKIFTWTWSVRSCAVCYSGTGAWRPTREGILKAPVQGT